MKSKLNQLLEQHRTESIRNQNGKRNYHKVKQIENEKHLRFT